MDKNREGTTHPDTPALKVQGKSKWKAREKAELWTSLGGELGCLQSLLLKAAGCQCAGHRGVISPEIPILGCFPTTGRKHTPCLSLLSKHTRCAFLPGKPAPSRAELGMLGEKPSGFCPQRVEGAHKKQGMRPPTPPGCRSPLPCAQSRSRSVQRRTRRANMESPRAVACSWMTERQSSERHSAGQRESSDTTSWLHLGSRVVRDE